MNKHFIPTFFLALFLAGCEFLGLASDESKSPIEFELTVNNPVVTAGERLSAAFVVRNNTLMSIRLLTGCDDEAPIGVYKDGEKIDFYNGNPGCYELHDYREIGKDRTFHQGWFIYAYNRTQEDGQLPDTTHVAPGEYTLRVVAHVNDMKDRTLKVEHLEVGFKVE